MLVAVEIFGGLVVISFSEIILLSFQVPLNNMFGYSTALRSMTQVKLQFYCKQKQCFTCFSVLSVKICLVDTCLLSVQGKGEFTMEYKEHSAVSHDVQMQLVNAHKGTKADQLGVSIEAFPPIFIGRVKFILLQRFFPFQIQKLIEMIIQAISLIVWRSMNFEKQKQI